MTADWSFANVTNIFPDIQKIDGYSLDGKTLEAEWHTCNILKDGGFGADVYQLEHKYDIDIIIKEDENYRLGFVEVERRHNLVWDGHTGFNFHSLHIPYEKEKRLSKMDNDNVFFITWVGNLEQCISVLGRDAISAPVIEIQAKHGGHSAKRRFFDVPIENCYIGEVNFIKLIKSYLSAW